VRALRSTAGPFFIVAGALHFVIPKVYRRIMPPYVPAPMALVYASGVAEIAGGAGLLAERSRRPAGWWLIATLIAVFPANLHMALNPDNYQQVPGGAKALWARLPLQGLLIAWVLGAMRR
jgi:uncharacterized membrane protein